ncbi:unnamed protein product [Trifolium pratense]|nr:unnamed protein product [Trifolium pratense]
MEAIPIYPMMTTSIPLSVVKEAQRLQRGFIWGETSEGRKYHAVSWEIATKPKSLGGLGLRRLDVMNRACLMKLGWDLSRGSNGMWCAVLRGKYGRGVTDMMKVSAKTADSSLWKNLVQLMPWIEAHYCRSIGNGRTTHAWTVPWIDPGLRVMDLDVNIPDHVLHAKVADLIDARGCWNWDSLQWLPTSVLQKLVAIPPPEDAQDDDINYWPAGKHGNFTVASAYNILADINCQHNNTTWNIVWKIQACERVRAFVWLLKHGRMLTHYRMSKMNLGLPFCTFCEDEIETELHVLRDCSKSMQVWLNIVHDSSREVFFNADFQQWINMNLHGDIQGVDVNNWQSYWAIACHALWTWRNKEKHDDSFNRPYRPHLVIKQYMTEYEKSSQVDHNVVVLPRVMRQIGWCPPSEGWIIINTDGAKKENHYSGCGGIVRGNSAEWCGGFAKGLGACSVEMAELWGAWEGLQYTWNLGFRRVELHLDSMVVVNMLVKKKGGHPEGWSLCKKILRILQFDWEVKIRHTYREANLCADALANIGCGLGDTVIFYESCPTQIRHLFALDAAGTTVSRLVSL